MKKKEIKNILINNFKKIYENGDCYIGQYLNGKRHGKGTLYNKNGKVIYEGEFVNDKEEGKGKYIYENGNYYLGHWMNGKKKW